MASGSRWAISISRDRNVASPLGSGEPICSHATGMSRPLWERRAICSHATGMSRPLCSRLCEERGGAQGHGSTVVLTQGVDGHLTANRSDDSHVLQYLRIEIGDRIREAMPHSQF